MFNNVVKCKILICKRNMLEKKIIFQWRKEIFFIKVYFDEVFYKEYFIVGEDIDCLCGEFLIFR